MSLTYSLVSLFPDFHSAGNHLISGIVEIQSMETPAPAPEGGVNDTIRDQAGFLIGTIKVLVVLVAVAFVIYRAVITKFAIGAILVAALVAGLVIWIVFNVDVLQGWVGSDLAAPSPIEQVIDSSDQLLV